MHFKTGTTQPARAHRIAVSVYFFIAGFTFASWASRIPHIQARLNLNEAALGSVLLALPAGLMVSSLLVGRLIARFGSKAILLAAATLYSTLIICLGLAPSTPVLVATLFFFGMGGNSFNVSVNTQAVGVERMYGRSIMASFHGIWSLAGFAGAALATLLIWLGLVPWQHFIIISAIGFLLSSFFASSLLAAGPSKTNRKGFSWPEKRILLLGAIAFGNLVCEGTMFDWSGVYFKKVVQAPASLTALGYAAFMGCMATGRFVADKVVMAMGSRKVLQAAGVLICAGFAVAVIFPHVISATLGFMLVGFGVCSVVPIVYSLAGQGNSDNPGSALASITTVGFAGFLAGPPLVGFVAQATNLRWSFALVACIALTTTLLAMYLRGPQPIQKK